MTEEHIVKQMWPQSLAGFQIHSIRRDRCQANDGVDFFSPLASQDGRGPQLTISMAKTPIVQRIRTPSLSSSEGSIPKRIKSSFPPCNR